MTNSKIFAVGITGASGVFYAVRLIEELLGQGHKVHLMITEAGWQVLQQELDWDISDKEQVLDKYFENINNQLYYHTLKDFNAQIASGSYFIDGMVVIPCSMGTLSGIAQGASGNLLERAADVMLKEKRKLLIVPRETPLNRIHIENMLTLVKAGAHIIPAMPGFYHKPKTIEELINHLVGKVLDSLEVNNSLFRRWGEKYD